LAECRNGGSCYGASDARNATTLKPTLRMALGSVHRMQKSSGRDVSACPIARPFIHVNRHDRLLHTAEGSRSRNAQATATALRTGEVQPGGGSTHSLRGLRRKAARATDRVGSDGIPPSPSERPTAEATGCVTSAHGRTARNKLHFD